MHHLFRLCVDFNFSNLDFLKHFINVTAIHIEKLKRNCVEEFTLFLCEKMRKKSNICMFTIHVYSISTAFSIPIHTLNMAMYFLEQKIKSNSEARKETRK